MSRKDTVFTKQYLIDQLSDNEVDLSMMELDTVPVKELALVTRATRLDLSRNQLKYLPENFGNLRHLISLDLSNNKLHSLPNSVGQLALLQRLDLYSNQLTKLPLTFYNLKRLKWLDLKNNPLEPRLREAAGTCINSRECNQCATKIMAYLRILLSQADRSKHVALEKQRVQEKLRREEESVIKRSATKREKELRRKIREEEQLLQQQEEELDDEMQEEEEMIDQIGPVCGRAREIEKRSGWTVGSVCNAMLLVSVTLMLVLVVGLMLCNNFMDPNQCQSIKLRFIKSMARIFELLGAKVD